MRTTSLVGPLLDEASAPPTQDSEKLRVPSCQSLAGLDPEWLKGGVMIYTPLLFQEEGSCLWVSFSLSSISPFLPSGQDRLQVHVRLAALCCHNSKPEGLQFLCWLTADFIISLKTIKFKATGIPCPWNLNTVAFRTNWRALSSYSVQIDFVYFGTPWTLLGLSRLFFCFCRMDTHGASFYMFLKLLSSEDSISQGFLFPLVSHSGACGWGHLRSPGLTHKHCTDYWHSLTYLWALLCLGGGISAHHDPNKALQWLFPSQSVKSPSNH